MPDYNSESIRDLLGKQDQRKPIYRGCPNGPGSCFCTGVCREVIGYEEPKSLLEFKVTKKNPKPNAPVYELKTVKDIFRHINTDNVDDFLKCLKVLILSKDMAELSAGKQLDWEYINFIDD